MSAVIQTTFENQHDKTQYAPLLLSNTTLLITHYNRSQSLERLLNSFRSLNIHFEKVVVSDDGSKPEHLSYITGLQSNHSFTLVTAARNAGLGNNINKGQDAVKSDFTLYVQEDFIPKPAFRDAIENALEIINTGGNFDIIRFYAYFPYPCTQPYKYGYSELVFKPWQIDHMKFYMYSDHPHLRRSDFFERFGRYPEGISGDKTEFTMCLQFLHSKGRALLYDKINTLFDQANNSAEPSTMDRQAWRTNQNIFVRALRRVYLQFRLIKNTYQLYSLKR